MTLAQVHRNRSPTKSAHPQKQMDSLIPHCSTDYQHQVLSKKENQLRLNNFARLTISGILLSFVVIQPLNAVAEWTWRFLKLPTFDPTGMETNFKELNVDKGFNRTLKEGDNILEYKVTSAFGGKNNSIDISTTEKTPIYAIGRPRNWLDASKLFGDELISVDCSEEGTRATVTSTLLKDYKFIFSHLYDCYAGSYVSGAIIGRSGNPSLQLGVELKGVMIDPPVGFALWALQGKEPQIEPISVTGDLKPLLETIRYAEGTDQKDGYQTMFGGGKFTDFSKHPDTVYTTIFDGEKLSSAAAGAYQYMPYTWYRVSKAINAIDFSPANQDRGAVFLIKERGVYDLAKQGEIKKTIFGLCNEWASLPCYEGDTKGAYNQNVKSINELMEVYKSKSGKK